MQSVWSSIQGAHDIEYAHETAYGRAAVYLRVLWTEICRSAVVECKDGIIVKYLKEFVIIKFILQAHLKKSHQEVYKFECGICGGRYKTEKTLKEHLVKKHDQEYMAYSQSSA